MWTLTLLGLGSPMPTQEMTLRTQSILTGSVGARLQISKDRANQRRRASITTRRAFRGPDRPHLGLYVAERWVSQTAAQAWEKVIQP
jgi:hypothetical protein